MKVDWKETFNPHDAFGSLSSALDEACAIGYLYVWWDGQIFESDTARLVGFENDFVVYINGVKHTNKGGEK